jgi:hypothetical protein
MVSAEIVNVRFDGPMSKRLSAVDWLFRSRETGRITIGQAPNVPLLVWLGVTVGRWLLDPIGGWRIAANVVAGSAIVVWASDEIVRGVNPWRRILGGTVLAVVAVSWWTRS